VREFIAAFVKAVEATTPSRQPKNIRVILIDNGNYSAPVRHMSDNPTLCKNFPI